MEGEAIIAVSAAVVACTQLAKWAGIPDKWGAVAVMVLSLLGIAFWGFSKGEILRTEAFDYFAAWIAVATSAAGVFGFTRAASSAVSSMTPPPNSGAGTSPTVKQ
jgi:hypothetical protein